MIQKGIDEGARLVAGGTGRPDGISEVTLLSQPSLLM